MANSLNDTKHQVVVETGSLPKSPQQRIEKLKPSTRRCKILYCCRRRRPSGLNPNQAHWASPIHDMVRKNWTCSHPWVLAVREACILKVWYSVCIRRPVLSYWYNTIQSLHGGIICTLTLTKQERAVDMTSPNVSEYASGSADRATSLPKLDSIIRHVSNTTTPPLQ